MLCSLKQKRLLSNNLIRKINLAVNSKINRHIKRTKNAVHYPSETLHLNVVRTRIYFNELFKVLSKVLRQELPHCFEQRDQPICIRFFLSEKVRETEINRLAKSTTKIKNFFGNEIA